MNPASSLATMLATALLLAVPAPGPFATTLHNPDREKEAADVRAVRNAGLHGDRSRMSTMIDWLHPSDFPQWTKVALHSLAQLGATEALPALDKLIGAADRDLANYARSARARLVAEAAANGSTADPGEKAALRLATFYRELSCTPDQMNKATVEFHKTEFIGYQEVPVEVYAMRDLADMAYLGPYVPYTTLPGIVGADFSLDYPSKLKMQLARLSHQQRIDFLIDTLSHRTYVGGVVHYEVQMLADEGPDVLQPVEKRLMEMDQHRTDYPNAGFNALFDVLRQLDDQENDAVWRHFRSRSDDLSSAAEFAPQHLPVVAGY